MIIASIIIREYLRTRTWVIIFLSTASKVPGQIN